MNVLLSEEFEAVETDLFPSLGITLSFLMKVQASVSNSYNDFVPRAESIGENYDTEGNSSPWLLL